MALGGSMALFMVCGLVLIVTFILGFRDGTREIFGPSKAAGLIEAAVIRDPAGQIVVEDNADLAMFAARNPGLWYIIHDGDTTLTYGPVPARPGIDGLRQGRLNYAEFDTASNGAAAGEGRTRAVATIAQTRAGPFLVEAGGVEPLPFFETVAFALGAGGAANVYILYIFILVAMGIAHFVVMPRLIARPVRRVARAAEEIDGLPAGRRLPDDTAPQELVPLIDAFNRALQRIDDAALSQRSFLANAAHELRTPLTRLRTKLDAIPDPGLRRAVVTDTQNLSAIVGALLHLARLSGQPHAFQPLDLGRLCRAVVAELVPAALADGVEIEVEAPQGPVMVHGVEAAVRLAIANLVRNAVRHAGAVRRVTVTVSGPGEARVIDHGPGIPECERERLFRPFARGAAMDDDGAGLGLAIVLQVMLMHGGTAVVSDTPGGGATVTLLFPQI